MASGLSPPLPTTRRGRSASRRRRRRRLVWLRVAAMALGVGLVAELGVAALTSPRFGVSRIEVQGAQSVPNCLVVSQAAIPDGANIFRLRRGQAARRVAALPAVRSASVRRRPPHAVVIQVVERQPVVCVQGAKGRVYVDCDGICFERRDEQTPAVELVGISPRLCRLGQRVRDRRIGPVLRVCAQARSQRLTPARLIVAITGEIELVLSDGAVVRLGEPSRLTEKLHKVRLVLDALSDSGSIEYLDVSCPEAVVWQPAEPRPAAEARKPGETGRTTR